MEDLPFIFCKNWQICYARLWKTCENDAKIVLLAAGDLLTGEKIEKKNENDKKMIISQIFHCVLSVLGPCTDDEKSNS